MKLSKTLLAATVLCSLSYGVHAASWLCTVHNGKGQTWDGTGPTRAVALENAMGFCSKNSTYARNCIVKYCRAE